jgi:ribulose-5-phosphate 4-epimerase/fuculose-1-phosphate aldolase
MTDEERDLRDRLARVGRSLFDRGYSCGSSGNISVRVDDGILITPTNASLGRLDPARIARVDFEGRPVGGDRPSKEVPLHLAFYRSRPGAGAVVHLHSTHAVALSCLQGIDPEDALPAITPYFVMRIGRLPVAPYVAPGDPAMAEEVGRLAVGCRAVLLANHGPVVSGKGLEEAVDAAEELEEAARLFLMLRGMPVRYLTDEQRRGLPEV